MAKNHRQTKKSPSANPLFDNFRFEPIRQIQAEAQMDFEDGKNLVLFGYAGTGKTYIAIAYALMAYLRKEINHIHIVRSAVSSRDIGFLPGTEAQKLEVYEKAIRTIFNKLLRRDDAYDCLKNAHIVSFGSTSFERGMTYDGTCIIVDEFQNGSFEELDTLVTRLGGSSKIILCGDTRQSDLAQHKSGFHKFVRVAKRCNHRFSLHEFTVDDIVRSGLVRDWIIAVEEDAAVNNPK